MEQFHCIARDIVSTKDPMKRQLTMSSKAHTVGMARKRSRADMDPAAAWRPPMDGVVC